MTDHFVFSDGAQFTTLLDALVHLKLNPSLKVTEKGTDVTSRLLGILHNHGYGSARSE